MLSTDDGTPWVIFDIDGTVADCRHRQRHIAREAPDWEAFFSASGSDAPLPIGVALATDHVLDGELLWLTGRPERYRQLTARWLRIHGLPVRHLSMRPDDDMRPAAIFKADRIQQIAKQRRVLLIVDDDEQVVAALRGTGWPVVHAQWMSQGPSRQGEARWR